jgi:multidrug efflux system membrane fusion protein
MNPQLLRPLEKVPERPAPAAPPLPTIAPPRAKSSVIPWLIFLVLAGVGGYFAYLHWQPIRAYVMSLTSPAAATGRGRGGGGPVPVTGAAAGRADVHVYLEGLGEVTPLKTVTMHTQVDGQIVKIGFEEGQIVHEKDLLAEIDPRPYQAALEQAKGKLGSDQAFLANAKIDLKRYQDSYAKDKAVSDQQVATQQALVDQYQANVVSDQGAVDAAQVNLAYCSITSPITGRIGLRLVDLGNIVHTTDTTGIAVITQIQPITVVFTLPEDDLDQIVTKPNGGKGLPVQAYDRDDQNILATGEVLALDNQVDPTTGTFKVKASFANEQNTLFPQQFVNAHLLADIKRQQTVVPTAAVQHGPDGGAFVYVVNSDQAVEIRNVREGASESDFEAVTGIDPDDVVVTDGTDKLQEGSKVAVTMASESYGGTPTTLPSSAATRPSGRRGGRGRGANRGGGDPNHGGGDVVKDVKSE